VCAAVSGGPDSVAMLLLLEAENSLKKNALGVGLSAVHVHHGLRGQEADDDLGFVQDLCLKLGIPLHVHRASVPDRLAADANPARSETLEEAARILRYEVFERLIREGHADSVLTAHTLDDQAETVVMKLLRGAWTAGLAGIYPAVTVDRPKPRPQGQIVRPLLAVGRGELIAYMERRGQAWRTDSTNSDVSFTRNRIRHTLLPILREYNPSLDRTLANLAELARDDEARWQAELGRILPQVLLPGKPVRGGGRAVSTSSSRAALAIEVERLKTMDRAMARRVLRAAVKRLGGALNFQQTDRLLQLALGEAKSGRMDISEALVAERSIRELRISMGGAKSLRSPNVPGQVS